jgi:hypothetical protein
LAADFREGFSGQRSKNGARPIQASVVAFLRWQLGKPLREVIFNAEADLADGRPLSGGPERARSYR